MMKPDFSGYATRNDLQCSDGRTIRRDAFKDNDGSRVPLVWQHMHDSADNVLGHADLENRTDGVYAYCYLNDTPAGQNAKSLVAHGDINSMSIYANKLVQRGKDVVHGAIREVSLVLSGANPGAVIDSVAIQHSDGFVEEMEDEAIITTGLTLKHEDDSDSSPVETSEDDDNRTIGDIVATMNEEQKDALMFLVDQALDDDDDEEPDTGEGDSMKHNVFDDSAPVGTVLEHSQIEAIFKDAPSYGSLSESVLAHASTYGINDIEKLFPDAKELNATPEFLQKERPWVATVMNGCRHTPFAKVKTTFADLSGNKSPEEFAKEARAHGYKKGTLKKEEVFGLLQREHSPQTIYKKQKLDRDDILDITDFDVVVWLKAEMQRMLKEELARAILIGDGRQITDPDKINETNIRSVLNDDGLYSIKATHDAGDALAGEALAEWIKMSMLDYEGPGTPTLFAHKRTTFNMLQAKDKMGRKLWRNREELADELEVGSIVDVPAMRDLQRDADGGKTNVFAIAVDLSAYNLGTNRGGETTFFDDFDIDYNQYKYLYETRLSGALVKPWSAVVVEQKTV